MAENTHVCSWWFLWTFDNRLRGLVHSPEKILGDHVGKGMKVADIGCGAGFFSLGLGRIVGQGGKVYAVDLQSKALEIVRRRAVKAGLRDVITTVKCGSNDIGRIPLVHFILAFWMVHETPDKGHFFNQVMSRLGPGGEFLFAEPKMHISKKAFYGEIREAEEAGFRLRAMPRVLLSRAALLEKEA